MENHHFSWVIQLFLWPFSIAMFVYQRVTIVLTSFWGNITDISSLLFLCIPYIFQENNEEHIACLISSRTEPQNLSQFICISDDVGRRTCVGICHIGNWKPKD